MKLDFWIRKLLPKDEKFYQLLEESTTNLVKAGVALRMLPKCRTQQDRENTAAIIKDIEHAGDSITHRIFNELNSTFVTPIDREDIHLLASALDDVLDHIDGVAARFNLYKVPAVPDIMVDLIEVLNKSIVELTDGVHHLRNLNDMSSLGEIIKKVNDYENQADMIFDRAIADLFEKEKDPITVIKLKEIFVGLETATDKCEDAANVLEGLLIKHN
jgi:predicted phosphate transport protein (TIGR00153 family)